MDHVVQLSLLDFSSCAECRAYIRSGVCPHVDLVYGECRLKGRLCKVYEDYLLRSGSAQDLRDYWNRKRKMKSLPETQREILEAPF